MGASERYGVDGYFRHAVSSKLIVYGWDAAASISVGRVSRIFDA